MRKITKRGATTVATLGLAAALTGGVFATIATAANSQAAWPQASHSGQPNEPGQYTASKRNYTFCINNSTGDVAYVQFRPNADPQCWDGPGGLVPYQFTMLDRGQWEQFDSIKGKADKAELEGLVTQEELDAALSEFEGGAPGEPGEPGQPGEDGQDGQDGVSGYEAFSRPDDHGTVPAGQTVEFTTKCRSADQPESAPHKVAIGGGANVIGDGVLVASYPSGITKVSEPTENDPSGLWAATSWTVKVKAGEADVTVRPFITCALAN